MFSLFSLTAGANVRWHDLPGQGIPVVFIMDLAVPLLMNIHGLLQILHLVDNERY